MDYKALFDTKVKVQRTGEKKENEGINSVKEL